ncbi:unnamed protein product [Prorocentrum cordatum]|uniref:Uncharacterized protein n=1 Tax=Prorocentrum cordatum TaxID=2364126 RepID=A0ABN9R6I0_9DINO|nr:unnamed protein product [Polarella glacialis]
MSREANEGKYTLNLMLSHILFAATTGSLGGPGGPDAHGRRLRPSRVTDPPPEQLVERLLLEREADARGGAKRRRLGADGLAADVGGEDGPPEADAELLSGDERARALREAREAALQALYRAERAAELLRRTTWGEEKVAFLKLLPNMQEPPPPGYRAAAARALEPAAAAHCAALRAAGRALAGPPPGGALELEATLRYLQPRWLVHFVRGAYAVELWREGGKAELGEPDQWPAGKFLAYVGHHPQHGPGVRFPPELSGAVEGRRRLAVQISPLGGRPAASAAAARGGEAAAPARGAAEAEPWEAAATRGEAVHAVLLDAQEALVDLCAFQRFRRDLLEGDAVRRHAYRWHLSRASTAEVSLTVPVGASAELLSVTVLGGHGHMLAERGDGIERSV